MSDRFGLVVRFRLRPGHAAAFDQLVEATMAGIRSREPGTLVYTSHAVDGEPDQRMFYEMYRDRASFEAHERQPHVRRFLDERARHVDSVTVDIVGPVSSVDDTVTET